MRTLLLACWLSLFLAGGAAFAQSEHRTAASTQKSDADIKEIRERVAWWLKTCLGDWDKATHMTREEWKITCERVAAERGKFLEEDPSVGGAFVKGRQR